ncbi:acyl-CoA thioesterase [Bifidobacterium xylocopae]|uniref:Acyl-CoA thioesterase II n=1 Tax=Bifidobacterium xylocopae TaxID=2493119 RepID=A0A366KEJ6_9BIFI|nr:acyl-CoA thioesterase domain-containing protein [Bifidobacterium xylocopae]RBP99817.1 acyl-CoA thioesterase II [Bifidobacterium xylocopae]
MNETPLQQAIRVLSPEETGRGRSASTWRADSLPFPTGRIYGGQIMAQSILAAAGTVPEGREPNSVHGYYIRTGLLDQEVGFDVEDLRDGRSYSTRMVDVSQPGRPILKAMVSFQESGQGGVRYADSMPTGLPDAEELTSARDLMAPYADKSAFAAYYANQSPFDIRHITPTIMLGPYKDAQSRDSGRQLVWLRADGKTDGVGQTMQRALLALACDQLMMEPALRRTGLSIATPGISYASIDHAMWWYEDIDMASWLLFVQDSAVAGHGRALCSAKVYNQDGDLLAAMAQEAMLRVPQAG